MRRVEGAGGQAGGQAASSDTTAVTRAAQNKPENHTEDGAGVSDCPGISPPPEDSPGLYFSCMNTMLFPKVGHC